MMDWLIGGPFSPGGELIWGASPWVLVLAMLVALAALGLAAARAGGGKALELACLTIAFLAVLWGLAEPTWFESQGRTEPGRTVILIDGSRSMGIEEAGGARGESALKLIEGIDGNTDVFTFGDEIRAGLPGGWSRSGTDIGAALHSIADRYLGQSLRSLVLLTDGVDRGGLRKSLAAGVTTGLPSLPGPLTVVQVGEAVEGIDQAVTRVQTGGFAFLRTPFSMTAHVQGQPSTDLKVSLRREGRLVDTKTVALDDGGEGSVRFEVTPNAVGRFVWQVEIDQTKLDSIPGNNAHAVVVRVVRDRTRVLQVCGSPSTDQKFLRLFLKEDPSVDLVSFFILRTHEDFASGWYPDELSLIAFPYERLFTEQLETFDVVIFQNFDFKPYFERGSEGLLGNIASFVERGGSFVMIGGDRSFDLGEYAGTPIASILPVQLGVTGVQTDPQAFRPELPGTGNQHPVTRIAGSIDESALAWSRLPELDGINRNRGLTEGSASLLNHPTLKTGGEPMPVLAVREVGEGRTMALMSDASWRWAFSEAATGRGNQAYLRFWKGALRWLVADPDDRRVVVQPSSENVLLNEELRITATVRDAGFSPQAGIRVQGFVDSPDGSQLPIEAVTDEAGLATAFVKPTVAGAHRIRVETPANGSAESVFSVVTRDPELAEVAPDTQFLQALADAYGDRGVFRAPGEDADPLIDSAAERIVDEQRSVSLSSVPALALIFGLFSSLAWWVRRRNGGR